MHLSESSHVPAVRVPTDRSLGIVLEKFVQRSSQVVFETVVFDAAATDRVRLICDQMRRKSAFPANASAVMLAVVCPNTRGSRIRELLANVLPIAEAVQKFVE